MSFNDHEELFGTETIAQQPFKVSKHRKKMNPFEDEPELSPSEKILEAEEFDTPELTEADRIELIRLRNVERRKIENGHTPPQQSDVEQVGVDQPQVPTMTFKSSRKSTSPAMDTDNILALVRQEEIEADLVRNAGRYIPNVDDVKPGIPFSTRKDERIALLDNQQFAVPLITTLNINSDGVTIKGGGIFDPGEGSQKAQDFSTNNSANPNDPKSGNFLTCSNKMCSYREGCLRYRLKNRRSQSFPFFPESCRKDGIYLSVNDSDYTGYDPFDTLERGASNVTSLPNP